MDYCKLIFLKKFFKGKRVARFRSIKDDTIWNIIYNIDYIKNDNNQWRVVILSIRSYHENLELEYGDSANFTIPMSQCSQIGMVISKFIDLFLLRDFLVIIPNWLYIQVDLSYITTYHIRRGSMNQIITFEKHV